jgi:hypothetical protein
MGTVRHLLRRNRLAVALEERAATLVAERRLLARAQRRVTKEIRGLLRAVYAIERAGPEAPPTDWLLLHRMLEREAVGHRYTMTGFADEMGCDAKTARMWFEALEQHGWLVHTIEPGARGHRLWAITEAGRTYHDTTWAESPDGSILHQALSELQRGGSGPGLLVSFARSRRGCVEPDRSQARPAEVDGRADYRARGRRAATALAAKARARAREPS